MVKRLEPEPKDDVLDVQHDAVELAQAMAANPEPITLDDGRQLGYSTCGDPDGDPLVVYHRFPNSRLFGALFNEVGR